MQSPSITYFSLVFALASTPSLAQFYTGAELRQDAQLLSLVGTDKATSEDYARIARLLGYIDGFVDSQVFDKSRGVKTPKDVYTFCLPANYVKRDLSDSVKLYLSGHTEPFIDKAPAIAVIARALRESFPCPKL